MTALRARSLLACLLASAFASPITAQEDPLQGAVLLDRVMATVNDAVILNREVLALTLGQISVAERERGRPLSLPEKRGLLQRNLNSKIDQHALAQGAITLGIIPPERVESIFQDQLREEERELVRKLGTLQAVTEEQARQGRNWETFVREQRVDKMSSLTRAMAVSTRFNNQSNLFITPRMMRAFYRQNLSEFQRNSIAVLGSVAFTGSKAKETAQKAAEAWRTETLAPQQLAARFEQDGALAPEALRIDDESRATRRQDQVEFALAGPQGKVSDPIEVGSGYRVWKVLEFEAAKSEPFDSPEVQRLIREFLEQQARDRLLEQTRRRAKERTHVWQPADLRREAAGS